MDYVISGDEGWWTGKCNGKVGMISSFFLEPKTKGILKRKY